MILPGRRSRQYCSFEREGSDLQIINWLSGLTGLLCFLCLAYQLFLTVVPCFKKQQAQEPVWLYNYAILIAARNEEAVLPALIASIRAQRYPAARLRIFVVADNCTDGTAEAARRAGAEVFERFDPSHVGKGWALDWLLSCLETEGRRFDGYFVFDADNLLDENCISEMNRVFSRGYDVVTGCRSAKNYGDNWISAACGLLFLRYSQFINRSLDRLGLSADVTGSGFLFSRRALERWGGWKFHLLCEDTECTARCLLEGQRVAYCEKAVFYDEQPTGLSQSFRQRVRWTRGQMQVLRDYGPALLRRLVRGDLSCWNILMNSLSSVLLPILGIPVFFLDLTACLLGKGEIGVFLISGLRGLALGYGSFLLLGAVTVLTQRRLLPCPLRRQLALLPVYPLFMFTYVPVAAAALFQRSRWLPIQHKAVLTLEDLREKRRTSA